MKSKPITKIITGDGYGYDLSEYREKWTADKLARISLNDAKEDIDVLLELVERLVEHGTAEVVTG